MNHNCVLCNSNKINLKNEKVRDRDDIQVLECLECRCLFLSTFHHINDEFYEESGMLNYKVELDQYRKKSLKDDQRRAKQLSERLIGKDLLDFGCGAGGLLHQVKDVANRVAGVELDQTINKALNDEGIKCYRNIEEVEGQYDFITLYHVVEHLKNPVEILKELKQFLKKDGVIIVEVPNADDALISLYNNQAFKDFTFWSCHLVLYNAANLEVMAKKADFNVRYVKQIQRYSLSNHLYWLSNDLPGGHLKYEFLNSDLIESEYEASLAKIGKCDTIMMEININ